MRTLSASEQWTEQSYEVRVRNLTYLWGSGGLAADLTFPKPLLLHIRNDIVGEPITISTRVASGASTVIGTLGAGECVTIPVQSKTGVFATCDSESLVACLIEESR